MHEKNQNGPGLGATETLQQLAALAIPLVIPHPAEGDLAAQRPYS